MLRESAFHENKAMCTYGQLLQLCWCSILCWEVVLQDVSLVHWLVIFVRFFGGLFNTLLQHFICNTNSSF